VRLWTRSIARRETRTIVTRPKSRASTHSSPPACRRRSGPRPGRALPAGRGCHFEQPDPHADSRGLRDPRRPRRLWGSSPRPPVRRLSIAALSDMDGWRHGGRAAGPTSWGANCIVLQGLSSGGGVQAAYGCLYPSFCLSDACSDTAYRDACTIDAHNHLLTDHIAKVILCDA